MPKLKLVFPSNNQDNTKDKENITYENNSPFQITSRIRKRPQKYDDFLDSSPGKQRVGKQVGRAADDSDDNDDGDQVFTSPTKSTASASSEDPLKSRHTENDLTNKLKEPIDNSSKLRTSTTRTPKRKANLLTSPMRKTIESTPQHVKNIIKKRIIHEVESDSDESDFSESDSDYVPEDYEKETESSETNNSSEEDVLTTSLSEVQISNSNVKIKPKQHALSPDRYFTSNSNKKKIESSESSSSLEEDENCDLGTTLSKVHISNIRNHETKLKEYVVASDQYFMMRSNKKNATSNHTLSRLKNLDAHEDYSKDTELSYEHRKKIHQLNKSHELMFDKWFCTLSENFNIVLYGFGSKRIILEKFQKQKLQRYPCVVVNGVSPNVTFKSVLESIVVNLLQCSSVPSKLSEAISLIDAQLTRCDTHLFLMVHNIDGVALRNVKVQASLANLAQINNVHIVATIDHVNAPLLWDQTKLSKFKFTWWDVTTFLPYTVETSFEKPVVSQSSGSLQISSLHSVYRSLTSNAKGIYKIIMEYQIENHKQSHYQGLPFKELYTKCREQFLVSSDVVLRSQLTEFIDHKLVKLKRSSNGSETLLIPIDYGLLKQFLEQQNTQ